MRNNFSGFKVQRYRISEKKVFKTDLLKGCMGWI